MKKYNQLLLLIVSIISLSLFLIYRHEYNRLHYVLEVFNFFGRPCNFSDLQASDNVIKQHDWGPQPIWQETDSGYIYSAFLTGKIEVKTISLQNDAKNIPRNCYLWFEDKKKPIMGKFKFSNINQDGSSALGLYFYICTLPNVGIVPYAVSFSLKVKKDNEVMKIFVLNTLDHKPNLNITVCVSPLNFNKRRFIEFLSFHRLIGIDSFIFYNKDIPHRLTKLISNLSSRLSVQLSFLPWNYPKFDSVSVKSVIENDCLLRTFGQTKFVTFIEINEYIVPYMGFSIESLIKNFKTNFKVGLNLPVLKFCTNNYNDNKPIALQNFEVVEDFSYNEVRYLLQNTYSNSSLIHTTPLNKAQVSVNKYVRCNLVSHKTRKNKNISKFSTDFIRTTLFQLLLHDQI